jgi:hypothetical protein
MKNGRNVAIYSDPDETRRRQEDMQWRMLVRKTRKMRNMKTTEPIKQTKKKKKKKSKPYNAEAKAKAKAKAKARLIKEKEQKAQKAYEQSVNGNSNGMLKLWQAILPEFFRKGDNVSIPEPLCPSCDKPTDRDLSTSPATLGTPRRCKRCEVLNNKLIKYGITVREFDTILKQQNYKCAICDDGIELGRGAHLDHCHYLEHVRGILCRNCNLGLGHFKDNPFRLKRAIKYLVKNEIDRQWWYQREEQEKGGDIQ